MGAESEKSTIKYILKSINKLQKIAIFIVMIISFPILFHISTTTMKLKYLLQINLLSKDEIMNHTINQAWKYQKVNQKRH